MQSNFNALTKREFVKPRLTIEGMEDDEESKEPKSSNIGSKLKPPSLTDIGINDQVDIKVGPA